MKNTFFAVSILFVICYPEAVYGQQNENYFSPNIFKVNVLSPFVLTASVFYERATQKQRSIQLGFFYTGVSIGDTKFRGFGVTPGYRFYLSATTAPEGFYIAPFLRYQHFRLTLDETDTVKAIKGTYGSIGGGGVIGKQWIFRSQMTFDIFLGFSYNAGNLRAEADENDYDLNLFNGFSPRAGVTIGYNF